MRGVYSMTYKLGKTWTTDEALQQSGKEFFWNELKRSANIYEVQAQIQSGKVLQRNQEPLYSVDN